jgi:hypothetical protein
MGSIAMLDKKNPARVSRPGTVREFQFPEWTDLPAGVNHQIRWPHGAQAWAS